MTVIRRQLLRGTAAQVAALTPRQGELVYDIEGKAVCVGDGATAGGNPIGPPPLILTAGEAIGGERVVYLGADGKAFIASASTATAGKVLGFSAHAAALGAPIRIAQKEQIPMTGLTVGSYFLGENGAITTTPPASGLLQQVGAALSATVLLVDVGEPIIR